jgi:hypothetical protein
MFVCFVFFFFEAKCPTWFLKLPENEKAQLVKTVKNQLEAGNKNVAKYLLRELKFDVNDAYRFMAWYNQEYSQKKVTNLF